MNFCEILKMYPLLRMVSAGIREKLYKEISFSKNPRENEISQKWIFLNNFQKNN